MIIRMYEDIEDYVIKDGELIVNILLNKESYTNEHDFITNIITEIIDYTNKTCCKYGKRNYSILITDNESKQYICEGLLYKSEKNYFIYLLKVLNRIGVINVKSLNYFYTFKKWVLLSTPRPIDTDIKLGYIPRDHYTKYIEPAINRSFKQFGDKLIKSDKVEFSKYVNRVYKTYITHINKNNRNIIGEKDFYAMFNNARIMTSLECVF